MSVIIDGKILGDMRTKGNTDYSSFVLIGEDDSQTLDDVKLDYSRKSTFYATSENEAYYFQSEKLYRIFKSGNGYKAEIDSSTVLSLVDFRNTPNTFYGMSSFRSKPILIYSKKESKESEPSLWLEILNKDHKNEYMELEYPKELSGYKSVEIIGELSNQFLLLMKSNDKNYILKYQIK